MIADLVGVTMSLAVLAVSGDQFVIGIARLAATMRVRPSVVGAVVGGLGASIPELVVAALASGRGTPQLALGSVVGSILANVCLALAIAALVAPVRVDSRTLRREAPISVVAVLLFALVLRDGVTVTEGMFLLVALVITVVALVANAGRSEGSDELAVEVRRFFGSRRGRPRWAGVVQSMASLAFMLGGAEILVRSASGLANRLGIGQGFVGLTLVAVGTSTPVIAIAIQAARRGNHDLVAGNVLGSNLFIALAGGALVAFSQHGSTAAIGGVAVGLMALVTVGAWGFMARGSRVTRWEGALLIAAYAATLPFLTR